MKPNILAVLKTLQLSLENGKSLTSALRLMENIAAKEDEKQIYRKMTQSIQDGGAFSTAVEKHISPSSDIVQFIAMAEKGGSFVRTLKSVVNFLEIKNKFYQESNDKIAIPVFYFVLTMIIVIMVRFFTIPFHLKETQNYDPKIQLMIADHLQMAQTLSDVLFALLIAFTIYFLIVMIAMFNFSGLIQNISKQYASHLPVSSKIIHYFEKFILLSLFSEMLKNGVTLKVAFQTAASSTVVPAIAKQFEGILEQISRGEKRFWGIAFFDEVEQHLLAGAGSVSQLGDMLGQFADRARLDALATASKFFRLITIIAILLLAFAVFVEFFTIVLTQVLIQQEIINSVGHAG